MSSSGVSLAGKFTSEPLRVIISASNKSYYLHRHRLVAASPYFRGLFSFRGIEFTTGAVTLSEPCDKDEAFQMFIEYVYKDDYDAPDKLTPGEVALLHAQVYLLADRLCTTQLQRLAQKKLVTVLCQSYSSSYSSSSGVKLTPEEVTKLVLVVYENTPDHTAYISAEDRDPMRMLVARYWASRFSEMISSVQSGNIFTRLIDCTRSNFWVNVRENIRDGVKLVASRETQAIESMKGKDASIKTDGYSGARKRGRESGEASSDDDDTSLMRKVRKDESNQTSPAARRLRSAGTI